RQMPEIIEKGHLYVAQPPLYKVSRGRSEVYLKDDVALEAYLIDSGLEGAVLTEAGGAQHADKELRGLVDQAARMQQLTSALPARYNKILVEQLALAGGLKITTAAKTDLAVKVARLVAKRMNAAALGEEEGGWKGSALGNGGYAFTQTVRGVKDSHEIDMDLVRSAEARSLAKLSARFADLFLKPAKMLKGEVEVPLRRPTELLETVLEFGRKRLAIQRYKGLGEMNPGQLWETTLDPHARSLLQVRVAHADTADEIFSKLMGEVVEARREFIQSNALQVANLDV
ncbi:MAG: DNA gyrase subunit B, partial [Sphingomonadales bacterium]